LPALPTSSTKALPQTTEKKMMMHDKLQEAVNELNFTDDQKGKLKDVFSDAKSKRESIMSDSSLPPDQKRTR
jgi:Spy/CpxP family protein refolding chaperone